MTFKVKDGVQIGSTLVLDSNGYLTTRLATARTIALSGDVSGSAAFDGSANISITATVADDSHSHSNYLTGESDTLASVTARGASTSTRIDANGGIYATKIGIASSNLADAVNGAPWYGIGSSTQTGWYGNQQTVQLAGYYGVVLKTANTQLDLDMSGATGFVKVSAGHVHIGNQTTPDNPGGWSRTLTLDGAVHSKLRLKGSAYGSYGASEVQLWIDNSANLPAGLSSTNAFYLNAPYVALNDTRSQIFYDSNDTSFYVDPNSQSRLKNLILASSWGDIGQPWNSQLTIRGGYPSVQYRSSTTNSVWLQHMDGSGEIQHYYASDGIDSNNWSIKHTMYKDGTFYSAASMRSPIFYDANDTSWYMDPGSTSQFNRIYANNKYHRFGTSDSWDSVGQGAMTNVHFQGHDHFWIGAGNGTWYTGSANSGIPSGTSVAHDLLLTTMYSDADYYRGITFATENTGAANNGWRLGKWYSGTGSMQNSRLIVDGQIFAKGNHPDEYDFYANNYDSYRNSAAWVGDSGAGWHNASIVAARAIQIQSGNAGTSSAKPQLQFHQYGYGGPSIEYDGPNNKLRIGDFPGANRMSHLDIYASGGYGPLRMNHDQIWTPSGNLHFQYSSGGNIDMNYGGGHTFSRTSLRSPIFYDFDNTGYYCDPNNTSNLNITQTASLNLGNSSTYRFSTSEWAGAGGWPGYTYTGGDHRFGFSSTSGKIDLWTDGIMYAIESHRSPIFYDYNDTAYYVDPASFTYLYGGIYNNGAHGNSSIVNRLLAGNNGAGTGEVRLQMWCSEPGNSWDWAGFGYNVDNNSNANAPAYYFGRPNPSFGQAYMRMATSGYWYFYTANTSGTRYTNMTMQSDGNTTFGGSITASGNVTAYSDVRLKDNVETVQNALDITRNLRGVFYTRKDDPSNTRRVGVIAQEIREYLPEVVHENIAEQEKAEPISTLTVDYGNITGLLIEAIKEQQDIIESQETRIARLEALVQQLIGD